MSQSAQGGVDVTSLSVQQLSALQSRLSQELEHLSTSYQRLRAAQSRFKDCIKKTPLLIPLTTSLYIPGTLASPSPTSTKATTSTTSSTSQPSTATLLIDIGTGFYVEKSPLEATEFYTGKIDDLRKNLQDIEKVVGGKGENLRVVEDVLRRKMVEEQPESFGAGGGGSTSKAAAG